MRVDDVERIATGYHPDPARSMSLRAEAYVDPRWPNTCLLRYPGRDNFMVVQILPDGPERTG